VTVQHARSVDSFPDMPQNVPSLEWTDDALRLRQFMFEFWCREGRAPNYRNVHEGTGMDRRSIIQAYKQLQLGNVVVVDEDTQNCNLIKAPPFSSFPSQVECYIDGRFHSYIGCASEAMAVSNMPPFKDKTLRLESYCVCCLAPITIESRNFELLSVEPAGVLEHINVSPWDWINVNMERMCDAMNFVLDAEHAARYERQTASRGILVPLPTAKEFVRSVAEVRMWDYHWPSAGMDPGQVIQGFRDKGVDVSCWEG
jgi:alkylmercury lyase-like protein